VQRRTVPILLPGIDYEGTSLVEVESPFLDFDFHARLMLE
jgi:hypothetical protein